MVMLMMHIAIKHHLVFLCVFVELLTRAITECDSVDIVIANTGMVDETNWEKCINTNLVSSLNLILMNKTSNL